MTRTLFLPSEMMSYFSPASRTVSPLSHCTSKASLDTEQTNSAFSPSSTSVFWGLLINSAASSKITKHTNKLSQIASIMPACPVLNFMLCHSIKKWAKNPKGILLSLFNHVNRLPLMNTLESRILKNWFLNIICCRFWPCGRYHGNLLTMDSELASCASTWESAAVCTGIIKTSIMDNQNSLPAIRNLFISPTIW